MADLNSGIGRGRIYRIVPTAFKEPAFQSLGKANTNELVAALVNSNAWHHEAAARLIHARQQINVVPLLSNVLFRSQIPLARLRAFNAIGSLGALSEPILLKGLTDSDERVRRLAVEYSQVSPFSTRPSEALLSRLQSLSTDPSIRVRMQLAFTLGEFQRAGKDVTLRDFLDVILPTDGSRPRCLVRCRPTHPPCSYAWEEMRASGAAHRENFSCETWRE